MTPHLPVPSSSDTSDKTPAEYSFPEFEKFQNEKMEEDSIDNSNSDEVINNIIFSRIQFYL